MVGIFFSLRSLLFYSAFLLIVGPSLFPDSQSSQVSKNIRIASLEQRVISQEHLVFSGNVEVVFDRRFHLWADHVEINYNDQQLRAWSDNTAVVKIETRDLVILADNFLVDLADNTGSAHHITINTAEGYVTAARAEKIGNDEWHMHDVVYTACDREKQHWSITAHKASVYQGSFLYIRWLLFKIGKLPVFGLPKMALPLHAGLMGEKKEATSGFLIPKFYIDYESGLGIQQEYYQHFADRCDMVVGVDWREKKGIGLSDEFRWVRSPTSFTLVDAHYVLARNTFKEAEGKVFPITRHRYWITGKDFFAFDLLGAQGGSLTSIDFGTDKRIAYQFFDALEHVDDSFSNIFINRLLWPANLIECKLSNILTGRKRFSGLHEHEKQRTEQFVADLTPCKRNCFDVKELENRVSRSYLPEVSWHNTYTILPGKFFYRHDLSLDHVLYREEEVERIYRNSLLVEELLSIPLQKAQVIRFDYQGFIERTLRIGQSALTAVFSPIVQVRSLTSKSKDDATSLPYEHRLFAQGVGRLFFTAHIEYLFPELLFQHNNTDCFFSLQPFVRWQYSPLLNHQHWFFIDHRDRFFAKNSLEFGFSQHYVHNNTSIDLSLLQGYDFNHSPDILPLRRSLRGDYLLPLEITTRLNHQSFNAYIRQEYDLASSQFVSLEFAAGINTKRLGCQLAYLFKNGALQRQREFLSNIDHFLQVDCILPLGSRSKVYYAGQFYLERGSSGFGCTGVKPLIHSIKFEYSGHCYGFYIGFEEKKYREFGHEQRERAIIFSLKLNSLGSFAKRFKQPLSSDAAKAMQDNLSGVI